MVFFVNGLFLEKLSDEDLEHSAFEQALPGRFKLDWGSYTIYMVILKFFLASLSQNFQVSPKV